MGQESSGLSAPEDLYRIPVGCHEGPPFHCSQAGLRGDSSWFLSSEVTAWHQCAPSSLEVEQTPPGFRPLFSSQPWPVWRSMVATQPPCLVKGSPEC